MRELEPGYVASRSSLVNSLSMLDAKTFLLTGGDGKLAEAFSKAITHYIPSAIVLAPNRVSLDVTSKGDFKNFETFQPDFVIHTAAKVNADYCELNPKEGFQSIVSGTQNALRFANAVGAKFVFPQSFLIFDGSEIPITESTIPNPLSKYGEFKLASEHSISNYSNSLVIRMGGFFGGLTKDKNFVGQMYKHLAQLLRSGGSEIRVGTRVWQPSYIKDLAENTLVALALEKVGTYNKAAHGQAAFSEVAKTMVEEMGISDRIEIIEVSQSESEARDEAKRPKSAILVNTRLQSEKIDMQRHWQEALIEYLNLPFFQALRSI